MSVGPEKIAAYIHRVAMPEGLPDGCQFLLGAPREEFELIGHVLTSEGTEFRAGADGWGHLSVIGRRDRLLQFFQPLLRVFHVIAERIVFDDLCKRRALLVFEPVAHPPGKKWDESD